MAEEKRWTLRKECIESLEGIPLKTDELHMLLTIMSDEGIFSPYAIYTFGSLVTIVIQFTKDYRAIFDTFVNKYGWELEEPEEP